MTIHRKFHFVYFTVIALTGWGKAWASDQISAAALGISFVNGSNSTVLIQRDGRTYLVDIAAQTVRETDPPAGPSQGASQAGSQPASQAAGQTPAGAKVFAQYCVECHGADGKGVASRHTPDLTNPQVQAALTDAQALEIIRQGKPGTAMPAWSGKISDSDIRAVASFVRSLGSQTGGQTGTATAASKPNIYQPGDDRLMTLPTGRPVQEHGLYINFSHRFAFDPAFSGPAGGESLFGLDSFALSSFGLRYGITKKLSVDVYREPTFIARPIQIRLAYNFLSESEGAPLNLTGAFAEEGENNFRINFAESVEFIASRSLGHRAQLYFVPTFSANARHLFSPFSYESRYIPHLPGYYTFSTGVGGAWDVRPTVALIAELTPTLLNKTPLGIHLPAYAFGIQKKIFRHAFTFGFTNAPAVTVSQRAGTTAAFLNEPGADQFKDLFISFDITRQLF
jgi:mono/diheme cytochrome c family protein